MNKKELIGRVCDQMRTEGKRKPISIPKRRFYVTDDDGNTCSFFVKETGKTSIYNRDDVEAVIDTCLEVIIDAMTSGEQIAIHGFGVLTPYRRAPRKTVNNFTGETILVDEHWVPKFIPGNSLKVAVKLWENEQREKSDA